MYYNQFFTDGAPIAASCITWVYKYSSKTPTSSLHKRVFIAKKSANQASLTFLVYLNIVLLQNN